MDWSIIVMAMPILAVGLLATLKVCLAAIAIGIVLGFALGFGALSRFRAVRIAVLAYVDFVRGTPLLVQIFLVYFALPVIGINFDEYWAGVIALSLNAGGFICMRHRQIILHVLFPQAWRRILPPLTNELISLIKGSALLSAISVYELTHAGQEIIATYFSPFEIFLLIALYYYALISALAWLSRYLERRLPQF
jgi:His/Glu/Gln/Arg/opine family amino acid ABC transporter permease subunit